MWYSSRNACCRRKTLYRSWALREHLGKVFRDLALRKESRVEEGHLMPDHVHMMLATIAPPKYAVSQVVGYLKGKSAIHIARVYSERKRNFVGQHFWARGYFVSTCGPRRGSDTLGVHQAAGTGRPPTGPDGYATLRATRRGWHRSPTRERGSAPRSRFERLTR